MTKANEVMAAVTNGTAIAKPGETLNGLMARIDVRKRFEEILGKKAPGFISSVIAANNANPTLKTSDPKTVLSAAVMAATLDLPINQNLGFAHIVSYKDKTGVGRAQFQMGWKGFVQLAMRTGQYKTMNAAEVFDGEIKNFNRITGELEIDFTGRKSDTIVGFVAYFKLINGFEKYYYMTKAEIEAHGKKYSKSYGYANSPWTTNFNSMALKTVLKLLLSKYGILSIEMTRAIHADQGVIIDPAENAETPEVAFPDATETDAIEPTDAESK